MYGYSFGAAAANVWHKTDYTAMLYPSYMPYTLAGELSLRTHIMVPNAVGSTLAYILTFLAMLNVSSVQMCPTYSTMGCSLRSRRQGTALTSTGMQILMRSSAPHGKMLHHLGLCQRRGCSPSLHTLQP